MSRPAFPGADIVYVRIFDAPRALVFRCLTEPAHLAHFWGPVGFSTPLAGVTIDPRPGGVFETVMVSDTDGSEYRMQAVYVEVLEPERLVWTDTSGTTTISTLVDLGDSRTEITIRQTNAPEAFRSDQARAGFSTSLDRFAGYLGDLTD